MKTSMFFLAALLFLGAVAPPPAKAQVNVTLDLFYDSLGDQGTWMDVGDYGYVWRPRVNDGWEPYSDGRWVYTDAGWTWVTDEPFGWATYHYGRWANINSVGWIWVPDTEWAPAWVSWRRSPTYVGWAPLPPEARFRRNVGFSNWVDSYYDIGPAHYRFVENRRFGDRDLRSAYVDRSRNVTIINNSTNITNITYVNNIIVNRGPDFEVMSRASSQPLQRLRLERDTRFEGDARNFDRSRFNARQDGDSLRVFAPMVASTARSAPPRIGQRIERAEVNRGWKGNGIAEAEAVKVRAKLRAEADKVPEALPEKPTFERPAVTATAEGNATTPGAATTAPGATTDTSATAGARDGKGRGKGDAATTATTPGAEATTPGATTTDTPATAGRDRKGRSKGETTPGTTATTPGAESTTPGAATTAERDRKGRGKGDATTPGTTATAPGVEANTSATPERGDRKSMEGRRPNVTGDSSNKAGNRKGDRDDAAKDQVRRAVPATPATPADPSSREPGTPARATPATPATPAIPSSESRRERPGSGRPDAAERNRSSDTPSRPALPSASAGERPGRPEGRQSRPEAPTVRSQVPTERPSLPQASRRPAPVETARPSAPEARPQAPRPQAQAPRVEAPAPRVQAPAPATRPAPAPAEAKGRGAPDGDERRKGRD